MVAAVNLPLFKDAPLVQLLSMKLINVHVILLNDADAAISSELLSNDTKEIYKGFTEVAMITLGTGIGVGLLLDGKLYQGHNGLIEAGHMIVDTSSSATRCGCGQASNGFAINIVVNSVTSFSISFPDYQNDFLLY
jgi:glucokinase